MFLKAFGVSHRFCRMSRIQSNCAEWGYCAVLISGYAGKYANPCPQWGESAGETDEHAVSRRPRQSFPVP